MSKEEQDSKPQKKQEPVIQRPKKAPKDWKLWEDYRVKLLQQSPDRLEAGAKQLTGLITLSLSVFGALGLRNLTALPYNSLLFIKVGLGIWLLAAFFALLVVVPANYNTVPNSTKAIKETLGKIIRTKRQRLSISVILFGIGLAFLIIGILIIT